MLSSEERYPTGEEIKKMLRNYMEKYNIFELNSPLQVLSLYRLIKKVDKDEKFCTCGVTKHYKKGDNRYELTELGEKLAGYMALHILLS